MEFHQTILPPPPPSMISLRASLGALWFRATSAVHRAFYQHAQRARRARVQLQLQLPKPAPIETLTSMISIPTNAGATLHKAPRLTCPLDDKWFRTTHVLGQASAK